MGDPKSHGGLALAANTWRSPAARPIPTGSSGRIAPAESADAPSLAKPAEERFLPHDGQYYILAHFKKLGVGNTDTFEALVKAYQVQSE